MASEAKEITELLVAWSNGDKEALNKLVPLVYDELHRIASSFLNKERPHHTLQPTALINEAFLRLLGKDTPDWKNRSHFFGIASRLMRQILVDYARNYNAAKRGYGQRITLDDALDITMQQPFDLVALDEALTELSQFDAQKSRVVELKFFGGLTIQEIASVLSISPVTVQREWAVAKAWLFQKLQPALNNGI